MSSIVVQPLDGWLLDDTPTPVALVIRLGEDLDLEFDWLQTDGVTAIAASSASGGLYDRQGNLLLSLSSSLTIVPAGGGGPGNQIVLHLPANVIAAASLLMAAAPFTTGSWQIMAVAAASGSQKILVGGRLEVLSETRYD